MPVYHSFLARLGPESVRVFLRRYDAYCREVRVCASQLAPALTVSSEPARPVSLAFCVDVDQLKSAVERGMISDCMSVEAPTDESLRSFLDAEFEELQATVTESNLAKRFETVLKLVENVFKLNGTIRQLVENVPKMDVSPKSAQARMKLLFMEYKLLLRINGLKCVTEKASKTAVHHILLVNRPAQLQTRLEQDIGFSHNHLKANFVGFMRYAIEIPQAFEKATAAR